ncbi:hypothetical protein TELCIR_09288 [Teladorsagia circumcincta]|uniref:Uncharacterized protein n=1 Tax=Teladorsagia circumcincta TaxID=45464 RepID=A0A2G9UF84_TELCI|nr:hypothetical protein TELCIR_09288 [Teladorsagia circumcincta]
MAALGGGSRNADQNVKLGPEWKWCGMAAPCGPGFIDTSGDQSLVYRIAFQPPLYSYVITRKKYEQEIKYSSECCKKPGQWLMTSSSSLVPDVSRVFVAHSSLGDPKWSNALFVRPRSVSQENTVLSRDFQSETAYDNSMTSQISAAPKIPLNAVECGTWKQQIADISSTSNRFVGMQGTPSQFLLVDFFLFCRYNFK